MYHYITYFEIAAFLSSLIAWGSLRKSSYLRWFPLLLFVVVSVEVYETFFRSKNNFFNSKIYNIQVPLQYLLYLTILYYATTRVRYKKLIVIGAILYILVTITSEIFLTTPNHFNVISYSVGSLFLIIFILAKLYEMLQNPTGFNFLKDPFFYILFAFLLFNVGSLPFFAMSNWLYYVKGYKNAVMMLSNVTSVLACILYLTYAIVFVWMTKKRVYSS